MPKAEKKSFSNKGKSRISEEEYAKKREANNLAVKKSREKSKQKMEEDMKAVERLEKDIQRFQEMETKMRAEVSQLMDDVVMQGIKAKDDKDKPEIVLDYSHFVDPRDINKEYSEEDDG